MLHAAAALHGRARIEDLAHVARAHEVGVVERLILALQDLEGDVVRTAERVAVRRRVKENGVVDRLMSAGICKRLAYLSSKLDLHRLSEGDGEAKVLALHRRATLLLGLLPLLSAIMRPMLSFINSDLAGGGVPLLALEHRFQLPVAAHLLETRLQGADVASGNLLRRRGRPVAESVVDAEDGVVGRLGRHLVGVGGCVHSRRNKAMRLSVSCV